MKMTIEIQNLLELDKGLLAASAAGKTPCPVDSNSIIHIVVSRDLADSHRLKIVEEHPESVTRPLARYSDSDLGIELEGRGYRVVKRRQF